ncbi:MAG: hypothetical protein GDA49_11965 [Rhodospirillales bacterium]|nr:hypothetical protein [Rhodospirillales bacterium]
MSQAVSVISGDDPAPARTDVHNAAANAFSPSMQSDVTPQEILNAQNAAPIVVPPPLPGDENQPPPEALDLVEENPAQGGSES